MGSPTETARLSALTAVDLFSCQIIRLNQLTMTVENFGSRRQLRFGCDVNRAGRS